MRSGAASDQEKLKLTDSLLDAFLGEVAVLSRSQPCLIVGDLNIEPAKIHCLLKESRQVHGFICRRPGLLLLDMYLVLPVSTRLLLLVVLVEISSLAALWPLLPLVGVQLRGVRM